MPGASGGRPHGRGSKIDRLGMAINWRRGRDSNPRYPCEYAAFRVRCFQPLSHLSRSPKRPEKASIGRTLCSQAGRDRQGRNAYDPDPAGTWALTPRMMLKSALFMASLRAQALKLFLTLVLVAVGQAGD